MPNSSTANIAGTSYDEIPYKSSAFPQTHPDRLATLALLFGLEPASVTRCRVLELGCASGANLVPMAYHLPNSKFVGVDLSKRQVDMANQTVQDLGLENIDIRHASILDINVEWGLFDYIICHGVYSWVDDAVQNKILQIASKNLAPQGVAYVSYNTYPGWHMREMIRQMMRYHTESFVDANGRIAQARALIDFLAGSVPENYYGSLLREELKIVQRCNDSYLFHEHLEEVNAPVYFHEFVERAGRHRLQYLSEADFCTMLTSGFPQEVASTLERISPDIVRAEQYMDFLRNRFFRQTLLCHSNVRLRRDLGPHSMNGLMIASSAHPESDHVDLTPGAAQLFCTSSGRTATTASPLNKAALTILSEHWPRAISQETLFREAAQRLTNILDDELTAIAWQKVIGDLLHCYASGVIELHTWQADFVKNPTERPSVSALAAYQVKTENTVTSQRHEAIYLDRMCKELVSLLDGTCDHQALCRHLRERVDAGALTLSQNEQPLRENGLIDQVLKETVQETLAKLGAVGMLVA